MWWKGRKGVAQFKAMAEEKSKLREQTRGRSKLGLWSELGIRSRLNTVELAMLFTTELEKGISRSQPFNNNL